ncbi:MAG: glycerol-3-phosphate 1-O-acyltransferase PlsY [Alphaproteobacteria bacterium]|nr:glycerol-3-phosphate 1-O-acyltransferase PlsY [Alphaproteobacteria bacterium]
MAILVALIAYLLGSIPCGLLLSKKMGEGDLRNIGSGNIGATNALRTGNKKLAALTLLLDMLKGTAAVVIAKFIAPEYALLAGLVAVLGHIFPVWLKFKGGKGVATGLGIMLGLSPLVFLLAVLTWLAVFKWKRISSLSALTAYTLAPIYAALSHQLHLALLLFAVAAIIFATHRQNIQRLLVGEEKPFTKKEGE